MVDLIKKQSSARIIALGFALLIFAGSVLLMLPCSRQPGVELHYIDALYTSTSAVCVTGLIAVDAGDTFTVFGQFILALLIQIGGLGVTTIGVGIMLAMGKKVNTKGRMVLKEATNFHSAKGLIRLVHKIFLVTIIFELLGAILSSFVFLKDYPGLRGIWISVFHSIAAFNNAGFDILGNYQNLLPYQNNVWLNLVTCGLVFFGGIGFYVIWDLWDKKCCWRKLSMHSKVVLSVSLVLTAVGTALIKTSTFFVLLQGIKAAATNYSEKAFHYAIPKDTFKKAAVITIMGISVIITGTYMMGIMEPGISFLDILFEVTSAFGTVGLSTGITPHLTDGSKILSVVIMYIGRLGPLTIATLWHFSKGERVSYPEGNLNIG